jgi:hypothetical protein
MILQADDLQKYEVIYRTIKNWHRHDGQPRRTLIPKNALMRKSHFKYLDMYNWLDKNIKYYTNYEEVVEISPTEDVLHCFIEFENPDDAMLFKLTWVNTFNE